MKLRRFHQWLGRMLSEKQISLEVRLFRIICLVLSGLSLGLIVPANLINGLPLILTVVMIMLGLSLVAFFWLSLRGKHCIRLMHFLCMVVLNAAWFWNAGVQGSIPYFFFPIAVYGLVFFRGRTRILASILLVVDFSILVALDRLIPGLVIPFNTESDRILDLISGFVCTLVVVTGFLLVVVKGYEKELAEKEILIGELYHRTKNNMQTISSIMAMQMDHVHEPALPEIFRSMDQRIQSLSLVQRQLFESRDLSHINLREYLVNLVSQLNERAGRGRVFFDLGGVEEISVLLDVAMPFGLVCNELLDNSLQHGFAHGRAGRVVIEMRRQGADQVRVMIADDGLGVPEGFNFLANKGLGLDLSYALIEQQLKGNLLIVAQAGVCCRFTFCTSLYNQRV